VEALGAFQADDEGSIPFTRSNIFKHLVHLTEFIPNRHSESAAAFVSPSVRAAPSASAVSGIALMRSRYVAS